MGVGSMSGLYIGVSGLNTNQTALNVTAHNLSNLDSEGYSRQQVLMQDAGYVLQKYGKVYTNQTGLGVSMERIRQVRDTFADKQYRLETGREMFYSSLHDVAEEVEVYFGSDVDEEPLKDAMTQFWSSLNELQKTPDSIVSRETVIQSAQETIDQAKIIYDQITNYQLNLNQQIMKQVQEINEIAEEIYEVNRKIVMVECGGIEAANDLRDRRNYLLDKLAGYADITYREDDAGCVTVNLEGTALVSEDRFFKLGTMKITEDSQLLKVVWQDHGNMNLYTFKTLPSAETATDVGSLKGLLYARGNMVANYTNMSEESIQWDRYTSENGAQLYSSLEEYYAVEGYSDYADYYEHKIAPYLITNLETQLDYLVHTMVTKVNDILCPNTTTDTDITATDANGNTVFIKEGSTILDVANAPITMGEDGYPGVELFSRKNTERYTECTYVDENGTEQKIYVYNEEDPYNIFSLYTIDELEINKDVIKNPSLLPISNSDYSNAQDVVNDLLDAWSCEGDYADTREPLTPNTLTGYNIQGYYNAMISELANLSNSYYNIAQNQNNVSSQLDDRRQVVAGVNSDEELSNMITYQQGFNAASRYINVVSEMLDTLINRM